MIIVLHYASTLYLALPVLKPEEKGSIWNGSVIHATSHPSSATGYKINAFPTYFYTSSEMPK